MAKSPYQRLTLACPRRMFSVAVRSRVSLWLGPDHLLQVDRTGFAENYKRFYFQDIQAITIWPSGRRAAWNIGLGVPLGLFLIGVVACLSDPQKERVGAIVCGIIAAILLIPLVMNNVLGPTCKCQLRTAVQTEDLPSLRRVRRTRKILGRIYPLIAAAQQATPSPAINNPPSSAPSPSVSAAPEPPPAGVPPMTSELPSPPET